jgi:hypothetical protein
MRAVRLIPYADEDDAIRIANDRMHGLSGFASSRGNKSSFNPSCQGKLASFSLPLSFPSRASSSLALNSRCLIVPLRRSTRTDLTRPTAPEILAVADDLQRQLLLHRFNYYRPGELSKIIGDERIHSRARDLYEALAISAGGDPGICARLLECFELQKDFNGEPLSPSHTAVLEALYHHIHTYPEKGTYSNRDLTADVSLILREMGEHICLNWRAVGGVLKSLGITNRKRIKTGWVIWLDRPTRKRVHDLVSAYNITQPCETLPPAQFLEECDICKDAREPRASEIGPAGSTAEDRPRNKWYDRSIEDLLE